MKDFKTILGDNLIWLLSAVQLLISLTSILIEEMLCVQILTRELFINFDRVQLWNLMILILHRSQLLLNNLITFSVCTKNSNVVFKSTFEFLRMYCPLKFIKLHCLIRKIFTRAESRYICIFVILNCSNRVFLRCNLVVVTS